MPPRTKKAEYKTSNKNNGSIPELMKELFQAAVNLRGSIEPSDYKRYVLPLIFLRFLSMRYEKRRAELEKMIAEPKSDYYQLEMVVNDPDEYRKVGAFVVPEDARWSNIRKQANADDIKVRLETAYEQIQIWDCWTEVPVRYGIPDALAWGTHGDRETLFWLEADSGHSSTKTMEANYSRRLQLAYTHTDEWGIPIIFCIMGPPWVVDAFRWCIPPVPHKVAVIGHDWRDFGSLPMYQSGVWREDLKWSRHLRAKKNGGELPFDPKQYPPKPKKKTQKPLKQKSTKPRFSKGSSDNDWGWKRRWSEGEE